MGPGRRHPRTASYGGYSITTDSDGSVWIAFQGDDGLYVQAPGSAATKFIDNPRAGNPSLVVRDGHVHLAYLAYSAPAGGSVAFGTVRYATNATGELTDEEVGHGDDVALEVDDDGRPLVLIYDAEVGVPLQFAIGATTTGSFSFQPGPHLGDTDVEYQPLAIDGRGVITATWQDRASTDLDTPSSVFYSRFDGAWSESENFGDLGEGVYHYARAVDDSGDTCHRGLWQLARQRLRNEHRARRQAIAGRGTLGEQRRGRGRRPRRTAFRIHAVQG